MGQGDLRTRQGAYIFGLRGPTLTNWEKAFFADSQPWGFILFSRNIKTPVQLGALTHDLRASVGRDAPVLIDQEGGRVQRMGPPHWQAWPAPLDQVTHVGHARAARSLYLRYRLIADELHAVGIDVNCAPCADIATATTHRVLRNRCLGTDAASVTQNARAVADGLLAGGVLPVLKHIPGLGRATCDSHLGLPHIGATRQDLETSDFAPFRALCDIAMGMSTHVLYDALDPHAPATVSKMMIGLIRQKIGFDGLLMSDDISMQALAGNMAQRCAAARAAGLDMVLHCNGEAHEMQAIAHEAGAMSQRTQRRAMAALAQRKLPDPIDISALRAELGSMMPHPWTQPRDA